MNSTFYFSNLDDFLDVNPDAEYIALGEYDYSEYMRKSKQLSSSFGLGGRYECDGVPIVKQSDEHPKWWFPQSNS